MHTQFYSLFCDECLKTCPSGRSDTYLHVLSRGEVLSVSCDPAVDSRTDVLPPPLAQGRVPLGEGGRQGKGGTQGMQLYMFDSAFVLSIYSWRRCSLGLSEALHVSFSFVFVQLASSVIKFTGIMYEAIEIFVEFLCTACTDCQLHFT